MALVGLIAPEHNRARGSLERQRKGGSIQYGEGESTDSPSGGGGLGSKRIMGSGRGGWQGSAPLEHFVQVLEARRQTPHLDSNPVAGRWRMGVKPEQVAKQEYLSLQEVVTSRFRWDRTADNLWGGEFGYAMRNRTGLVQGGNGADPATRRWRL